MDGGDVAIKSFHLRDSADGTLLVFDLTDGRQMKYPVGPDVEDSFMALRSGKITAEEFLAAAARSVKAAQG